MAMTQNDFLLSCLALFFSWILLASWLPTWRLVPYAFIAGLLAASGVFLYSIFSSSLPVHQSSSHSSFPEPSSLSLTLSPARTPIHGQDHRKPSNFDLDLAPFASYPALSTAADTLLTLVLRDYVRSWFGHMSSTNTFPATIRRALIHVFHVITTKAIGLDPARIAVTRLLPIIISHHRIYSNAETMTTSKAPHAAADEIQTLIVSFYNDGRLHPAVVGSSLDMNTPQQHYLRRLLDRLLPVLMPDSMLRSLTVTVLVREIMACAVLLPVLQMLSDPDILNQWIEAYGRAMLSERKNVQRLRAALDAHAAPQKPRAPRLPQLHAYDNGKDFQRFIRAVQRCINLYDVHEAREHLNDQIQDYMTAVDPDVVFLRRLEDAQMLLDRRVQELSKPIPPPAPSPMILNTPIAEGKTKNPKKNSGLPILPTHAKLVRSDLRRGARSSPNLLGLAHPAKSLHQAGPDDVTSRSSLFGDDDESFDDADLLGKSTVSIRSDESVRASEPGVVAAVRAALEDIIDGAGVEPDSIFSEESLDTSGHFSTEAPLMPPGKGFALDPPKSGLEKPKPSLDSLGLIETQTKRTVFSQSDLFGEDEMSWEEDAVLEENPSTANKDAEEIREAAPGDLGLAELIQVLTLDIAKLEAQQSIVGSLTKKAELTGASAELRILTKSRASLEREIRVKELQRQHYIVQENDNSLFGKAHISITSIMVGTGPDGHEFALYVVEVVRRAGDKTVPVMWSITRRYNEFHELHRQLRQRYPAVRDLDFPRRQVVLSLAKDVLKKRRAALEKYLRALLTSSKICRSLEFRAFLSQQSIQPVNSNAGATTDLDRRDLVTRIYNSVTDGMEDYLGNLPVLDQLSLAGQNLISAASNPAATPSPLVSATASAPGLTLTHADELGAVAEAQAELSALDADARATPQAAFMQPLSDAFLELFNLNATAAAAPTIWLRGRAVVVVLQQLLGGTVERRVRDAVRILLAPVALARHLDALRELLWPGGGAFRASPPARTQAQKAESRRAAEAVLCTLLPDVAGAIVSKGVAKAAARRVVGMLNHERLLRHLVYEITDEMVEVVFGVRLQPQQPQQQQQQQQR